MERTLTAIANEVEALEAQIRGLEAKKAELNDELVAAMVTNETDVAYADSGLGWKLGTRNSYDYKPGAYAYIESKGLMGEFIKPPKLTQSGIEALRKADKLNYADLAEIEKHTIVSAEYQLRKVTKS